MELRREKTPVHRIDVDLLAVPVRGPAARGGELESLDEATGGRLLREAKTRRHDVSKPGTVYVYQTHGGLPAEQIALIGVGEARRELTRDDWRRFAGVAVDLGRRSRSKTLAISVAQAAARPAAVGGAVEGALLAAHPVRTYKSNRTASELATVLIVGASGSRRIAEAENRARCLAEATCFARDLVNEPAEVVTPVYLAQVAQRMKRDLGLAVRVLGPREMAKLRMGAILGVGRGSVHEPRLIELKYTPRRATRASRRGPVALVGKGITFDSGGLSLKPAGNMEIQKRDMAGAAAVLGAMRIVAQLGPPIEVRGYVASAENMPSGDAYRPGDVLHTHLGKTVEVLNTDAEGRLVLADALAWAAGGAGGERPRWVVDIATLTGAVTTALGRSVAGVMGTDPTLVRHLIEAGEDAGEPMWELPLVEDYTSALESLVADLKNVGDGTAGSIFGGLFLREFVDGRPWAHLDIASVAYADKAKPYVPRGAVGWGVRSLYGLVERIGRGG